jgi:flagellar basal-body rod protein FlgF
MDRLAFNASAAIAESRTAQHMVNNELANVSTPGFKRSFESAMVSVTAVGAGFSSRIQPKSLNVDTIIMTAGIALIATGNDLDIAMNDKAVLGVTGKDGTVAYTRRGDLRVSAKGILETGNGHAVLGQGGSPITIPPGFKAVINTDGAIYADNPTNVGVAKPVLIDRLMLRDAEGIKLSRRTDGLFGVEGKPNGAEIPSSKALLTVNPKCLEGSNVNALSVMVRLMDLSRSFEMNVNVIKQSKDSDESGATMMRNS